MLTPYEKSETKRLYKAVSEDFSRLLDMSPAQLRDYANLHRTTASDLAKKIAAWAEKTGKAMMQNPWMTWLELSDWIKGE